MKKILMFTTLAALVLLSACKDDKYRTKYSIWGSQESGMRLIGPEGATYNPVAGSEYIPAIPAELYRARMNALFYLPEGRNAISGDGVMDIELIEYHQLPTKLYSRTGTGEADDPIIFPAISLDPAYSLSSQKPGASTSMNYLDMYFAHRAYMKGENEPIDFDPVLVIDETIVPGPRHDTINMRLFFDNNPDGETPVGDTRQNYVDWISFDLEHAAGDFDFPTQSGPDDDPITYIIKLAYKTYQSLSTPEEDETQIRYVTCEWTPADPYGENE